MDCFPGGWIWIRRRACFPVAMSKLSSRVCPGFPFAFSISAFQIFRGDPSGRVQ